MDYVVGSVAALISGNVTPNRPKIVRRALTPTKHQASPNVTPKSEFVEDRSIFLSPTQLKKKAIVKKSPKRIFENPDLDATEDSEGNSSQVSPRAHKVKKHLKEELDADGMAKKKSSLSKSPSNKSLDEISPKKKPKIVEDSQISNSTPKKKKKRESNVTEKDNVGDCATSESAEIPNIPESNVETPKKKQRKSMTKVQMNDAEAAPVPSAYEQEISISNKKNMAVETITSPPNDQKSKKNKKQKNKNLKSIDNDRLIDNKENSEIAIKSQNSDKKKKNRKNKIRQTDQKSIAEDMNPPEQMNEDNELESDSEEVKSRNIPNPKAITEKDSDSEHDSDNDIESENEQENEKVLTNENQPEESSDEEEQESSNKKKEQKNQQKEKNVALTEEDVKRTLFVGNVPFSAKSKKEIKKIFAKYGQIDTIRIRTIPVKDARVTPKLAIIKNELHPERTTVNVYVKYADPASVRKALVENNTVLNGFHLRVSPSESTGAEHDPHCAVFIGNMPFALEDDALRTKFEKCGEITSVRIIRDKKTNAGKGFGYVNFASKDGVELALALPEEDLTIKNRILRVKRCMQQKPGSKPGGGGKWGNKEQGGGRWGSKDQGGGNRGSQGQGGRVSQGQGGGKWGSQGQGGRKWGSQGQGGGKWGSQGQGGGKWGGQGQGERNRGGQGQGERNRGGQGQGERNRGGQGQSGGNWSNQGQGGEEGAARRLLNKRKQQEGASEAPANKRPKNVNQPVKEKKPRKEFVGMTAEKKKKHKFDKGQKKKKALSEILTKKL